MGAVHGRLQGVGNQDRLRVCGLRLEHSDERLQLCSGGEQPDHIMRGLLHAGGAVIFRLFAVRSSRAVRKILRTAAFWAVHSMELSR